METDIRRAVDTYSNLSWQGSDDISTIDRAKIVACAC